MYTLFWEKGSGSIVVQAMLEELKVPFERRYVDMESSEHHGADYLQQNPAGMVPALTLPGGHTIGESAAILLHLGEQCGDGQLAPRAGDAARPDYLFWLLYMATSGYMTFARFAHPERYTRDQSALEPVQEAARDDVAHFFDVVESGIAGAPWFLPFGYSALDIYLTMLAGWHPHKATLFETCPKVGALCSAVEARPLYQKVLADHA